MSEVGYFELGVADVERGRAFYSALFGWTFQPGPGGGYAIHGSNVPGGIHGGDDGAGPYVFFRVDDIAVALARVCELGGSVDDVHSESENGSSATYGSFRLCRDDQGSPFGLYQPPTAEAPT